MKIEELRESGIKLHQKLSLPTYPIAITYIQSENEIPGDAIRPSAMGQKMSICQSFTYARSSGVHVAVTGDDNFCVPGSAVHKWVDVTDDEFIESQVLQGWHKNRDAEVNRNNSYNSLFQGPDGDATLAKMKAHIGLVCSPLKDAIMEPDTILVFGNGVHMTHLIQALCFDYTLPIVSAFEGFGETCMKGGYLPFITGQPQVVIPGMGDRAMAGIAADELAVGIPVSQFPVMMENLFKAGGPMNPGMPFKSLLPSNLTENLTPGFTYLRKVIDKKKD